MQYQGFEKPILLLAAALALGTSWPTPLVGVLPCSLAMGNTQKSPLKTPNLQKLFKKGAEAFAAKNYAAAAEQFSQLLQKQPDYDPAKILLARSYYQLKRFNEAYKIYLEVNELNQLDADPSYEFGQLAFRVEDFANAVKGFRNIPSGHPLSDLAGYYGGIAALKLGDYELAIDLFKQAIVLPSKLVKSQRIYQKEAERLFLQKQKQELAASNPQPPASANNAGPPKHESSPEPPKLYRYLTDKKSLRLQPLVKTQSANLSGSSSEHQILLGRVEGNWATDREGSNARLPHWLLGIDAGVQGTQGISGETLVLPAATEMLERYSLLINQPRSIYFLRPQIASEWSLNPTTSLGLGVAFRSIIASNKDSKSTNIPEVEIFIAQKQNNGNETLIKGSAYLVMQDGQLTQTHLRQLARLQSTPQNRMQIGLQIETLQSIYHEEKNWLKKGAIEQAQVEDLPENSPERRTAQASLEQKNKSYLIEGPPWQARGSIELAYGNDSSVKIKAIGFYEYSQEYRYHIPKATQPYIDFNSNVFGATLRTDFVLHRTIELSLQAQLAERITSNYKLRKDATDKSLKDTTDELLKYYYPTRVTTLQVGLNIGTGS